MTDKQRFEPDWFSKPGDSLLSLMQRRNVSADQLAKRIEGGIALVRGIVAGEVSINEPTASVLATAIGGSTEFWVSRQANYERALERAVQALPAAEAEEWLTYIPSPGPKPRGRISEHRRTEELRRRLAFFNVSTLSAWHTRYRYNRKKTRFRTSPKLSLDEGAVSMWLRQGELEADLIGTGTWQPALLEERLPEIRGLSRIGKLLRFLPRLKRLCAEAGVAVVILRAPAGCRASGASRLIAPDKAMLLLSFRHRSDDQFWFTVLHELGHLLLHGGETFVDDDRTLEDDCERQANEFASSWIIPEARRDEFERLQFDRDSIIRFSVSVGVAPGLIVGQMQHRGMIGYDRMNSLKRRWTWADIGLAEN